MKKWIHLIVFMACTNTFAADVSFNVTEIKNLSGRILLAIYNDPGQFPDMTPYLNKIVPINSGLNSKEVQINLPAGDYAVAVFLDQNGNGKLDKNFLGIPKERFGFSKNPRILTGAPSFQECEIKIEKDSHKFDIKLIKLL